MGWLSIATDESLFRELVPKEHVRPGRFGEAPKLAFHEQRMRIDARAQALVARCSGTVYSARRSRHACYGRRSVYRARRHSRNKVRWARGIFASSASSWV